MQGVTTKGTEMKAFCRGAIVPFFCFLAAQSIADHPDVHRFQSAPRPSPTWLKAPVDQGLSDPRLKGYFTPPGFRLEIVADYPTVVNPVGMTFDDAGTPYVLEWLPGGGDWNEVKLPFTYKDGTTRQVAVMKKTAPDVVKVLKDTKGKGVYDQATVILNDELPSSILVPVRADPAAPTTSKRSSRRDSAAFTTTRSRG
jgi:hypothetical protein